MGNEEIKFPLSKKARMEFSDKYEKIFFKKPVHNISDEKLVEMVNSNLEKLGANEKLSNESSQEGIQDEENGQGDGNIDAKNGNTENGEENGEAGVKDEDYETASAQYEEYFGRKPLVDYDSKRLFAEIEEDKAKKLEIEDAKNKYFALFGKQPLEEMTIQQINSQIANEEKRLSDAKVDSKAKKEPKAEELEFDSATQMVIVNKKNPSDKRVINKATFDFLKHDFEEVPNIPKELKNK